MKINKLHIVFFLAIILAITPSCSVFKGKNENHKKDGLDYEQQLLNSALFIDAKRAEFRGENEEAVKILKQVLQTDPENHAAAFEISRILAGVNLNNAIKFGEFSVKLDPRNKWYLIHLSNLYTKDKNYKKAVDICEDLVKYHPDEIENYYYLVNSSLRNEDPKKAIDTYNKMESKFGFSEEINLHRKDIYLRMTKYDEAENEMLKLIQEFPENKRYYGILADIYMTEGKDSKAIEAYEKVLAIDPEDGKVHVVLSSWYSAKNQVDESFSEMKLAFKSSGLGVDDKIEIMVKMYNLINENPEEISLKLRADSLLDILSVMHPNDPKVLAMQADYLVRDKKWNEALEAYAKVIEIDSTKYPVWEQLVLITRELEDYSLMQNYARRAMDIFPQYPILYYFNAKAQSHLKRFEEAEASLNLGLSFVYKPTQQAEFYTLIGMVRDSLLRYNEAEVSFEKALIANPNFGEALSAFALHLASLKKEKEKAISLATKAVELNYNNVDYIYKLAKVLFLVGEMEKSEIWIKKGLNLEPENKILHLLYGDWYKALGKLEEANKEWKMGGKQ